METVKMHGAAFDGSGDIVNRDVPIADVEAFKRAGYSEGYCTEEGANADTESTETKETPKRKKK